MKSKKYAKLLLKLLVSSAFVAWLVFKVDWREVLLYSKDISLVSIVLYVALFIMGLSISALKWKILAGHKNFKFSLKKYFETYLTGAFLNNFFPSFIGGDTYRAYQIGKEDKRYAAAASTVVMDRITGLLGAVVLSVFFGAVNYKFILSSRMLSWVFILLVSVLFVAAMFGAVKKLRLWKAISKLLPVAVLKVAKDFSEYEKSEELKKSMLLSLLYNFFGVALLNYILFMSIGINIGIIEYLSVIFLVSIVSSVPISINNIGIKEWAYVTFFGLFGISSSAVVTIALVSRVLQMLVSFTALPAYLRNK